MNTQSALIDSPASVVCWIKYQNPPLRNFELGYTPLPRIFEFHFGKAKVKSCSLEISLLFETAAFRGPVLSALDQTIAIC